MSFEERFRNTIKEEKAKNKKELKHFKSRKRKYQRVLQDIKPSVMEVCRGLTKVKRWGLTKTSYTLDYFGDEIPTESCPARKIELRYPTYLPRFMANLLGIDCDRRVTLSLCPPTSPKHRNIWDEVVLRVMIQKLVFHANQWRNPNYGSSFTEEIFVDENSNENIFEEKLADLLERASGLRDEKNKSWGGQNYYISREGVNPARVTNGKLILGKDEGWIEASSGLPAY